VRRGGDLRRAAPPVRDVGEQLEIERGAQQAALDEREEHLLQKLHVERHGGPPLRAYHIAGRLPADRACASVP
jgi:hypothetical protein